MRVAAVHIRLRLGFEPGVDQIKEMRQRVAVEGPVVEVD